MVVPILAIVIPVCLTVVGATWKLSAKLTSQDALTLRILIRIRRIERKLNLEIDELEEV